MCLAIPMQVTALKGSETDPLAPLVALVEADGIHREIRLEMVDRLPEIGEYVIIHAGFAIHTLSEEEAQINLKLMRKMAEALEEEGRLPEPKP
ncbi:HypC/HybG/HupF family hydrogenase formation chaperone [Desulfogranum mediterraneum]|uniref:HypC/HybG/HupF family hydrogenase formation chaperone n=1 Tax=Desulfogranum mediterraneum TaxID=160661 RepID=UPI00040C53D2|nr:HypC/HybG/HupF family hydrogenase formation chaperone [Desulfogranum mediterraneum]